MGKHDWPVVAKKYDIPAMDEAVRVNTEGGSFVDRRLRKCLAQYPKVKFSYRLQPLRQRASII